MTTMTDQPEVADLLAHQETTNETLTTLEELLRSLTTRVEDLEDRIITGPPPTTTNRVFPTLEAWVDNVYARLAARHDPVWCTNWPAHDEAVRRLKSLWDTWEEANAIGDPSAIDDWMRARFDHHGPHLNNPEGTFRSCKPGLRCDAPPKLPATHQQQNVVTHLRPATRGAS